MATQSLIIKPTQKQFQAYQSLLTNDYVFLGGGAGGGKSWWLCESRLKNAIAYPGYRSFIGRKELKRLMSSTYQTWLKVCAKYGVKQGDGYHEWKLNGQYNFIQFGNGSRIDLLDVKKLPSDPLYERFGSVEYTDGALEECGEIDFMAFDVLKSRVGRHKNDEFGLRPTLAMTGNPKKNWTHTTFFLPWSKNQLPQGYDFIQSLFNDNPYTAELYEKSLGNIRDKTLRERLKDGNWNYSSAAGTLFEFEAISDLWTNTLPKVIDSDRFMTVDMARLGGDKIVLYFWRGFNLYAKEVYQKQLTTKSSLNIKEAARRENIPYSHIIIDEDGVGGGVVDQLVGVHGFVNNSSPLENKDTFYDPMKKQNFSNLKTQCAYVMAQKVNKHEVSITIKDVDTEFYEYLPQELGTFRILNPDDDTKKMQLVSKDKIKEELGRSPDYGDAFIMRAWFTLKNEFYQQTPEEEIQDIWNRIHDADDFDPYSPLG